MPRTQNPVDLAMHVAGQHFGVTVTDIRSQRRSRTVHTARTWGMYLAAASTGASFEEIGKRFGGRDHTIVRAVARGRAREVADNPASAELFESLSMKFSLVPHA